MECIFNNNEYRNQKTERLALPFMAGFLVEKELKNRSRKTVKYAKQSQSAT